MGVTSLHSRCQLGCVLSVCGCVGVWVWESFLVRSGKESRGWVGRRRGRRGVGVRASELYKLCVGAGEAGTSAECGERQLLWRLWLWLWLRLRLCGRPL